MPIPTSSTRCAVSRKSTRRGSSCVWQERSADARTRSSRALVDERERLFQDLHDGCIQSIYAVGLTLEAAMTLNKSKPREVGAHARRLDRQLESRNSGTAVLYDWASAAVGRGSEPALRRSKRPFEPPATAEWHLPWISTPPPCVPCRTVNRISSSRLPGNASATRRGIPGRAQAAFRCTGETGFCTSRLATMARDSSRDKARQSGLRPAPYPMPGTKDRRKRAGDLHPRERNADCGSYWQ